MGSAGSCLKNFSFERLLRGFNESLPAWQTIGPDDVEPLKARVPLGFSRDDNELVKCEAAVFGLQLLYQSPEGQGYRMGPGLAPGPPFSRGSPDSGFFESNTFSV